MTNKTMGVALVAVIIAIGGYLFPQVQTQVQTQVQPPLGSVAGPELFSPFWSVDGVRHEYRRVAMKTSTTTPCAINAPNATSSLIAGTGQFTVSSTTASTIYIAKGTVNDNNSTTTLLNALVEIGANGTGYVVASTTGQHIFGPNQPLIVGMKGGNGTFSPTGICQAEWVVL